MAVAAVAVLGQHLRVLEYRLLAVHSLASSGLVVVVMVVEAEVLPAELCLPVARGLVKICWAEQVWRQRRGD